MKIATFLKRLDGNIDYNDYTCNVFNVSFSV